VKLVNNGPPGKTMAAVAGGPEYSKSLYRQGQDHGIVALVRKGIRLEAKVKFSG
jgi:hypothetical protein